MQSEVTRICHRRMFAAGAHLRYALAASAMFVAALWSVDLLACVSPFNHPYEPDSDASVEEPLERPELSLERVRRGTGPQGGCGESYSTSCDDVGQIDVRVSPTPENVGYVLRKESGTLPEGLVLPEGPITLDQGRVSLTWIDEATDDQEEFDFTITVTPVDPEGEPGPTSEQLRIVDSGPAGCRTSPGGPSPLVAPLLVLIVLGCWRGRRVLAR